MKEKDLGESYQYLEGRVRSVLIPDGGKERCLAVTPQEGHSLVCCILDFIMYILQYHPVCKRTENLAG